jgi:membrane protease YdiL (CAAX protease family)
VTAFDIGLTLCLVVLVPGYTLARSLREGSAGPSGSRTARYLRTLAMAGSLLLLLAAIWAGYARPVAWLGLDWPLSRMGWIGLGIATVLLLALSGTLLFSKPRTGNGTSDAAGEAMLPQTPGEWRLFLLVTLVIGAGWELLYRGYLIWVLEPQLGTPLAVAIAAIAYGVAHGYRGPKMFAGSIAAALLFTLAFVWTRSLWWLIAIHIALPLIGSFARGRQR